MKSLKPSAIREIFKALADPTIISFAAGNPAPESFPVDDLARISADIFRDSATTALQYSVTEGYPPLREDVKARLSSRFGIGREEAVSKMRRHDRTRKQYHNRYSENKWGDSRYYDICINSSKLGIEKTAVLLTEYIRERMERF